MKAFIEILAGIIRVGPEAERYGDPYDGAVAFSVDGETATVKALASDRKLRFSHYRAAKRALERLGLKMRWERKK